MEHNGIELSEFLYLATTRCNCRCKHCTASVYTGKDIELTSEQIIEQYEKSAILKNVPISVAGGEPFLKEDLDEFILYLAEHNIPCVISTNGWFTEKIEGLLQKLGGNRTIRFAISIDGVEEKHDDIRRCKGIYKRALDSARIIKEYGFQIQVNTCLQRDSLQELDTFNEFFMKNEIPVIYIPKIFVGDEKFDFTTTEIKRMLEVVDYPRGKKYLLSRGNYLIQNCHAGRSSWVIDCNGDVYTCWGGYYKENSKRYIIGNLLENDFDTMFVSEKKELICQSVVDRCEGCLLPRDIERETEIFQYSTKLTYEEVATLKEELSNVSLLQDYAITYEEWYEVERIGNQTFRWMKGRNADIYVRATKSGNTILRIEYLNGKPDRIEDEPISAFIYVNGEVISNLVCQSGRNEILTTIEVTEGELIQVGIKLNRIWRPCDYVESSDMRELGLAVFKVYIE